MDAFSFLLLKFINNVSNKRLKTYNVKQFLVLRFQFFVDLSIEPVFVHNFCKVCVGKGECMFNGAQRFFSYLSYMSIVREVVSMCIIHDGILVWKPSIEVSWTYQFFRDALYMLKTNLFIFTWRDQCFTLTSAHKPPAKMHAVFGDICTVHFKSLLIKSTDRFKDTWVRVSSFM